MLADPDRPLDKLFADMRQTSYKVRLEALLGHSLLAQPIGVCLLVKLSKHKLVARPAQCFRHLSPCDRRTSAPATGKHHHLGAVPCLCSSRSSTTKGRAHAPLRVAAAPLRQPFLRCCLHGVDRRSPPQRLPLLLGPGQEAAPPQEQPQRSLLHPAGGGTIRHLTAKALALRAWPPLRLPLGLLALAPPSLLDPARQHGSCRLPQRPGTSAAAQPRAGRKGLQLRELRFSKGGPSGVQGGLEGQVLPGSAADGAGGLPWRAMRRGRIATTPALTRRS